VDCHEPSGSLKDMEFLN